MSQHTKHKLADKLRQRKEASVDTSPHLIVEARAGTGKTTTGIEGLRIVLGGTSKLIPSPQQLAVWEAMAQSKGLVRTVGFVAFSKAIAVELVSRVPAGCWAMTMHSLGFRAVLRAFGDLEVEKNHGDHVQTIIAELLGKDIWELRRNQPTLLKSTQALVSLCKMTLTGGNTADYSTPQDDWDEALGQLAAHYDVDLDGESREVFDLVPRVLERCKDVEKDNCVDFDDMIWLPIVLDLPVQKFDLLCVDEAQDLNRCQQALAMKAGRRLILFGDPRQAIYGFAGADAESMPRMTTLLEATERGCITLPLTVTRRCGRAIVEEAKKIVPDFEAHKDNLDGNIRTMRLGGVAQDESTPTVYHDYVEDGDMLLCRVNAPLVSECFKFLKWGRKANIQGRDVGQGLVSTIKRVSKTHQESEEQWMSGEVTLLLNKLNHWLNKETQKEQAKRTPNEARLIALQDRVDCIYCFALDAKTVDEVIQKIQAVFTDDKDSRGIMLSSIHKAKGLEAERVFLLEPKGATIPHPMASSDWQREQEMNLRYVAITRAISELIYVS